jgi:hypothetical protein
MNGKTVVARPVRRFRSRFRAANSASPPRAVSSDGRVSYRVHPPAFDYRLPCRSGRVVPKVPGARPSERAIVAGLPIPRSAKAGRLRRLQVTIDHVSGGGVTNPPNPATDANPAPCPTRRTVRTGSRGMSRNVVTMNLGGATRSPTVALTRRVVVRVACMPARGGDGKWNIYNPPAGPQSGSRRTRASGKMCKTGSPSRRKR